MNDDANMSSNAHNTAFVPSMESPHVAVGGVWVRNSYPWTRIARCFACRVGHPYGGRCQQDGVKLGRRFVGWYSLHADKHWMLEKKPTTIGGSHVVPSAISQTASGVGPWRVMNRRLDHPFTR